MEKHEIRSLKISRGNLSYGFDPHPLYLVNWGSVEGIPNLLDTGVCLAAGFLIYEIIHI